MFSEALPGLEIHANYRQAAAQIEHDILAASEEIAIYWPGPLSGHHSFAQALLRCNSARVRFYIQGAGSRSFPTELRNAQVMDTKSTLGVGLIGIDRKRLWLVLDPTSTTSPFLRLDLPQTVSLLYALWRLVPETDLAPGKCCTWPASAARSQCG